MGGEHGVAPPWTDRSSRGGELLQVQGKDRNLVEEAGRRLGLEGTYIPKSYIEQVIVTPRSASATTHVDAQVQVCGLVADTSAGQRVIGVVGKVCGSEVLSMLNGCGRYPHTLFCAHSCLPPASRSA